MRAARIKPEGVTCYHVWSRIVNKDFLLDDVEKRVFLELMRRAERFSGVKVLDYCIMDNHFHLLVEVPLKRDVSDGELLERVGALYGGKFADGLKEKWDEPGNSCDGEKAMFVKRMHDVSEFVKTLKQRYSMHYNRTHKRQGTLWEGRFHSTVVEHNAAADTLRFVAGYVDTNPVRAKIAGRAESYAWSGFGAACAGDSKAQQGMRTIYSPDDSNASIGWDAVRALHLENIALWTEERECRRNGITMPLSKRIPLLKHGGIIGSRGFVEDTQAAHSLKHLSRNRPKRDVPETGGIHSAHAIRVA